MFESISKGFQNAFRKLSGKHKISEKNIDEGIVEVRRALLQADVNYKVVKDFIKRVKEQAVGQAVVKGIEPYQQFIKILHDELVELMGPVDPSISMSSRPPTVIMLVGLQGSGKTTTATKLAKLLIKKQDADDGRVRHDPARGGGAAEGPRTAEQDRRLLGGFGPTAEDRPARHRVRQGQGA